MALRLYNTLTRRKEPFEPLDPALVRMYVCGPTVYDYAHIGNARPVVVFDVLYRLLRHHYGPEHVFYVRNITDIDDKIIKAAGESGETIDEVTARTTRAFHEDMAALGALPPDREPRATEHVGEMIAMINQLVDRGHAYEAEGHVLFHVPSFPDYGRLSGRDRDEMIAGARVEVAPYKKDPADFVLWKPSSAAQPGWVSPWGCGRPGWHIECSAMSEKHLGFDFDIHGGGQDLVFPHHENEIAQSLCAYPEHGFARYWLHNGYLMAEGEKMSKSLGNFYTVRDLLHEFPGEAIRLLLLKTHYRQPLDFTKEGLAQAKAELDRWYRALREASRFVTGGWSAICDERRETSPPKDVLAALYDDMNTPAALSVIHALADQVFSELQMMPSAQKTSLGISSQETHEFNVRSAAAELLAAGELLGILRRDPEEWFKSRQITVPAGTLQLNTHAPSVKIGSTTEKIEALIAERAAARNARNFAEADRIRDALKAMGVELEDRPDGTTDWRRAG